MAKDEYKIKKYSENVSPIEHITDPLKNIDSLDKLNYQYDRYTEPDVYKQEASPEDNYDILHDILNYILESSHKADLIRKIGTLSNIITNILESKKEENYEDLVTMILLRIQGLTYAQIAKRIDRSDMYVIQHLKSINDAKILLVLSKSTELNQRKKYSGGNSNGKHKDKLRE